MKLGENIIKIRKENKLTQDKFAEKYYVTRQTVSNWENGKSYPDLETLVKISDDFNISLDILLKEDSNMIKDISKKQKDSKLIKIFVIILNIIGILCLIYFAIPYLKHDMTISNPNSMLPFYKWDSCGMTLTIGFIPLVIANVMAYLFIETRNKYIKVLFFIPSILCLLLVAHYWFIETDWTDETTSTLEATIECTLNKETYNYEIYLEDGEYSLGIDDQDNFPLDEVDYTNKDSMISSIKTYYEQKGGSCS